MYYTIRYVLIFEWRLLAIHTGYLYIIYQGFSIWASVFTIAWCLMCCLPLSEIVTVLRYYNQFLVGLNIRCSRTVPWLIMDVYCVSLVDWLCSLPTVLWLLIASLLCTWQAVIYEYNVLAIGPMGNFLWSIQPWIQSVSSYIYYRILE